MTVKHGVEQTSDGLWEAWVHGFLVACGPDEAWVRKVFENPHPQDDAENYGS